MRARNEKLLYFYHHFSAREAAPNAIWPTRLEGRETHQLRATAAPVAAESSPLGRHGGRPVEPATDRDAVAK